MSESLLSIFLHNDATFADHSQKVIAYVIIIYSDVLTHQAAG